MRLLDTAIAACFVFCVLQSAGRLLRPEATSRLACNLSLPTRRKLRLTGTILRRLSFAAAIPSIVLWVAAGKEMRHLELELVILAAVLRGLSASLADLCGERWPLVSPYAESNPVERFQNIPRAVL